MIIARGREELERKSATVADLTLNGAAQWVSSSAWARQVVELVEDGDHPLSDEIVEFFSQSAR